jgi:hypothetical protein
MAVKKSKKREKYTPGSVSDRKARKSHKAESLPFAELEQEGSSIEGTFQGRKQITIKDRNTHLPKDIWVYRFVDESGNAFLISGRTMLDQAFEELAEEEGGLDRLIGEDLRINRGDDERTSGGFSMGTYEIMILE